MDFEGYTTSAYGYWSRAREILSKFEQSRHQLFYAAYELRCAMEVFLFEYLEFLRDGDLTAKLRKLYSEKDLKAAILKIEPHFTKRIEFSNLIHRAMGLDVVNIPVPDLARLAEYYGRIGGYMHIQKQEMDSDGWNDLETLIKQTQTFLHDLVHPQKSRFQLTGDGEKLFEAFMNNHVDEAGVVSTVNRNPKTYFSEATFVF